MYTLGNVMPTTYPTSAASSLSNYTEYTQPEQKKIAPSISSDERPALTPVEINIFALLRELTALLQQLYHVSTQQKMMQSLYQLELQITAAANIRNTGDQRWYLGFAKITGMALVLLPHGGSLLDEAGEGISKYLHDMLEPLRNQLTAQNFVHVSQAVEGVLSVGPQIKIAENDAFNKEADAYGQSNQLVQSEVSKQLDQLSQMIREIITQSIKEIHNAHYQALGSVIRA
jgi:hypothetical protein